MAGITIDRLADHPEALDAIAGWIDAEWGGFSGRTLAETRARFAGEPPSGLPVTFVAMDGAVPLGVATLRERDSVDWDPGRTPWVCNVYVDGAARGRGVGALLCRGLEAAARALGYPALHLASRVAGGSLYERIGYRVYGSVDSSDGRLALMSCDLGAAGE
jgi:GNAT superfamily N-acetyltransferase